MTKNNSIVDHSLAIRLIWSIFFSAQLLRGVKTNRTPAARSSDFVITRMITDRNGLHSVLLFLLFPNFVTRKKKGKSGHMIKCLLTELGQAGR